MTAEQFNHRLLGLQQKMFSYALTLTTNEEDANDLLQETNFIVETSDSKNRKRYKQVFTNNMSQKEEPQIE